MNSIFYLLFSPKYYIRSYTWKCWLIDYLLRTWNFHLYGIVTVRPMFGVQRLWAGRDLYRATPALTWDLGIFGLIQRIVPFNHLLRHTRGCRGPVLTLILISVIYYDTHEDADCWSDLRTYILTRIHTDMEM
jgi:hypothetical protein